MDWHFSKLWSGSPITGRVSWSKKTDSEWQPMHEIELPALDGGNLLAFLAALGTLRVLTESQPEANIRVRWVDHGFWKPVIHHSGLSTAAALVDELAKKVCGDSSINDAWSIGDDLTLEKSDFRKCMESE